MTKKTNWEKIFKLGDRINKDLKLTESDIINMVNGVYTEDSTHWIEVQNN